MTEFIEKWGKDGGAEVDRKSRALHKATYWFDKVPRALDAVRNRDIERIRMADGEHGAKS